VELARLAIALCDAIDNAKECGTFPLPADLVADKPEQTLSNLTRFFDPVWDPIHNPGGRFRRYRDPYRLEEIAPTERNNSDRTLR
jgi:hypothetical protein